MTLQMYLLEHELEAKQRGLAQGIELGRHKEKESVAIKLIRRSRLLQEIQEDTGVPRVCW